MPPRGSEGLDFTPILTHYVFLFTTILALVSASLWLGLMSAQLRCVPGGLVPCLHCSSDSYCAVYVLVRPCLPALTQYWQLVGHASVGTLWFAIFLELFLILGVLHTLATDSIAMHRFQISVFGAVAIVFAVIGVNQSIFSNAPALDAVAAGWLILSMVNIVWTLYFTSEEDSLMLHLFNFMGTGGLTPPGRRRRRTQSMHNMTGNGYTAGYAAPGALGPTGYDAKPASFAGPTGSGASFKANSVEARSITGQSVNQNAGSIRSPGSVVGGGENAAMGLASPAMSSGAAGVGAGGGPVGIQNVPSQGQPATSPIDNSGNLSGELIYRAKAMYPCKSYYFSSLCSFDPTHFVRYRKP